MKTLIFHSVFVIFLLTICLNGIYATLGNLPTIDEDSGDGLSPTLGKMPTSKSFNAPLTASQRTSLSIKDRSEAFRLAKNNSELAVLREQIDEPVPVDVDDTQPTEPAVSVDSSGNNEHVMNEVPKDAKGRPSFAPASHDGVQSGTFGGTAHPSALSRSQTLMGPTGNLVPALNGNKRLIVIKDDTYMLPIKFLPASFVGTVNISLSFALHKKVNVVKHEAEIKPENDGILHVEIPMANWAIKDHNGYWKTTEDKFWQPHMNEVVINILQSNLPASAKKLFTVTNVEFDKSLVVLTDTDNDNDNDNDKNKGKVHIVDKFGEQLIHLYDPSRVEKKLDALKAKLDTLQNSIKPKLDTMRDSMIEMVRQHLLENEIAVQQEITKRSEASVTQVNQAKTNIKSGNELLIKHLEQIANVEKEIQKEVENIGTEMKNIEVKVGALKTAEEAQLNNIKTGTVQHINVEHKTETEDLEKKIHQPMKDITGKIVALKGTQDNSFNTAKLKVNGLLAKEKATEDMVDQKMRTAVTALVNAVEAMGILVTDKVEKPVDQLVPNMRTNFVNYMGNPKAIVINGVEIKGTNRIAALLLVNMANSFKFNELTHAAHRSVSVPVQ